MVIPTYNEAAHISDLLRALAALPEPPILIVVDDASPDGTATLAEAEAMRLPGIRVIRRAQGKGGRGGACLEGFRAALDTQAELIGEPYRHWLTVTAIVCTAVWAYCMRPKGLKAITAMFKR